jgi:hypothetical protein
MGARRLVRRASLPDAALTRTGAAWRNMRWMAQDATAHNGRRAVCDAHTTRTRRANARVRTNAFRTDRRESPTVSSAGVRLEYLGGVDAQHTQQKVEPVRIDSRSPILARVPNNGTDKSEWKYGYREQGYG